MKIGILSDLHDNLTNTATALVEIEKLGAEALICCGDFCSPGPAHEMTKFKGPLFAVFGNNDGDKLNIFRRATALRPDFTFFQESEGTFEWGGRKIALTHYPRYAIPMAKTGDYDLVCFGHDHSARIEIYGQTLAVNPGTLNFLPFRPGPVTFAIYDAAAHAAKLYNLDGTAL